MYQRKKLFLLIFFNIITIYLNALFPSLYPTWTWTYPWARSTQPVHIPSGHSSSILMPEKSFLITVKSQKSAGTKSGEYGGCSRSLILFLAKNSNDICDLWIEQLPIWSHQVIFSGFFFLQDRQKPLDGVHKEGTVDGCAPVHTPDIDGPSIVKEVEDHLFLPWFLHFGFDWSWWSFRPPFGRLLLALRTEEGHHRLIHSHDGVEKVRIAGREVKEHPRTWNSLKLLIFIQKLWNPSRQFLWELQILVDDPEDCRVGDVEVDLNVLNADPVIGLNELTNSLNELRASDFLLLSALFD